MLLRESLRRRLAAFRRRRTDGDLQEELRSHVELAEEDLQQRGVASDDARRTARLDMGGVTQAMERLRDQRGLPWLDDLTRDLTYACRTIRLAPGFALVVVLTLGLAVGAGSTVFTFVNAIAFRPLPFDQPDRIVSLASEDVLGRAAGVSRLDFSAWQQQAPSFAWLSMFSVRVVSVSDRSRAADQRLGAYIPAGLFARIGQRPLIGRDFQPADDRADADPAVILGYGVWADRYGSDAAILGRTIRVNRQLCTVIGVMPPGFHFPDRSDIWLPWSQLGVGILHAPPQRRLFGLRVFGRLAPGATRRQAQAELDTIAGRLARDSPESDRGVTTKVGLYDDTASSMWLPMPPPQLRRLVYALTGAVLFILFVACANVANLLLVRSSVRAREMAVRLSLGASRGRVIRQLLTESLVLSALSGVAGLGLSLAGVRIFGAMLTSTVVVPAWMAFPIDGRVMGFLTAVCVVTPFVFGFAPAIHIARTDVNDALKEAGGRSSTGGRRTRRWTAALMVAEVALTCVLLAGAGFMLRSLLFLYHMDLGIETSHLVTASLYLQPAGFRQPASQAAFYARVEERLRGVPGIQPAALINAAPLGYGRERALTVDGRPSASDTPAIVRTMGISAGYFDALGIRVLRGRGLTEFDAVAPHLGVVVTERVASLYFAGEDAIGHRIALSDPEKGAATSESIAATIVGIVPNFGIQVEEMPAPLIYLPYRADPELGMYLVVRSPDDPARVERRVREELRAVDPDLPLTRFQTLDEYLASAWWQFRVFGSVFGAFATIALVLSGVGLYAVASYAVTERRQEIGVRMALGARAGQVVWLVLRRSLVHLTIAVPIGIAGAVGVHRLLQSLLPIPARSIGPVPAVITGLVAAISLAACLVPARRATRVDPLSALRDE